MDFYTESNDQFFRLVGLKQINEDFNEWVISEQAEAGIDDLQSALKNILIKSVGSEETNKIMKIAPELIKKIRDALHSLRGGEGGAVSVAEETLEEGFGDILNKAKEAVSKLGSNLKAAWSKINMASLFVQVWASQKIKDIIKWCKEHKIAQKAIIIAIIAIVIYLIYLYVTKQAPPHDILQKKTFEIHAEEIGQNAVAQKISDAKDAIYTASGGKVIDPFNEGQWKRMLNAVELIINNSATGSEQHISIFAENVITTGAKSVFVQGRSVLSATSPEEALSLFKQSFISALSKMHLNSEEIDLAKKALNAITVESVKLAKNVQEEKDLQRYSIPFKITLPKKSIIETVKEKAKGVWDKIVNSVKGK